MTASNQDLDIIPIPGPCDPAALFDCISDLALPVWLDSSGGVNSQYHILSALPENHVSVTEETRIDPQDFVDKAHAFLDENPKCQTVSDIPFAGGLIGYVGYDFAANSADTNRPLIIPDAYFGLYLWAIIVDKDETSARLIFHPNCDKKTRSSITKRLQIDEEEKSGDRRPHKDRSFTLTSEFQTTVTEDEYKQDLETIHNYILDGDVYQVNYSQHFQATYTGDSLAAYLALRKFAPAPYSGYLKIDDKAILCHSPEQFIEVNDRQVRTRPIKGTAPRASDPQTDLLHAEQLQTSEKDQAENLMIVDLMRNDLGRHCEPGSIKVSKLFELKSYSNVHHLVSEIVGTLNQTSSALDLLASASPGGSITGAPKQRAMEIINTLEHHDRSFYCGSLGYLSLCGRMDTNIGIRSLVADGEKLHCWGGGGIVADSDSNREYQETLDKIGGLLDQLEKQFLKC